MYEVKSLVKGVDEIPPYWIYRRWYKMFGKDSGSLCSVDQPFDGRLIRLRSLFSRDTTPSMFLYYKNGTYLWKDFSSGMGGDMIDFVANLVSKNRSMTQSIIIEAYENYLDSGGEKLDPDLNVTAPVTKEFRCQLHPYDGETLRYWANYLIELDRLRKFKCRRLSSYGYFEDDKRSYECSAALLFGFENNAGVYQIYRPGLVPKYLYNDPKYLIGSEQLEFKSKNCGIISGLKDIMAIDVLDLDSEYVAPSSETTILSYDRIEFLRSKYDKIFTLFDNDESGIKSMKRYENIYDIPSVRINLEKDLADNNTKHRPEFLKAMYALLIDKAINK